MAVQAEFGESASEAGIRQVEVEPTAPISDVSLLNCQLQGYVLWDVMIVPKDSLCTGKCAPIVKNHSQGLELVQIPNIWDRFTK